MATKKFRCKVCGYVHEGDKAPDVCPVCGAPASEFEEISDKKGFDTNSNNYTLIYATVLVIIVALVLALTSSLLKSFQEENVRLDKKKQILSSLKIDAKAGDPATLYEQYIKNDMIIDAEGNVIAENGGFDKGSEALVVYVAEVDGQTKYVIPVYGAGLWGAIWGYVSLNDDKNTVYGTYFSHASETPGLGAEIATSDFQQKFESKKVSDGNEVKLSVVKNGKVQNPEYEVDGISGGTITSTGVSNMLHGVLGQYTKFLNK